MIGFGTYRQINLEVIKNALNSGYQIFDTAQSYNTENLLGQAIKNKDRTKLIIISKISPDNLSYKKVIQSGIVSSKNLETYIDYYLIHVPNKNISLTETFGALKKLKEKKIIKNYGVSNFSLELLKESLKYNISAVQEEYSLIYLNNLKQLKLCKKNKLLFFSYMPLSNGFLLKNANLKNFKEFEKKYNKTAAQIALNWVRYSGAIPIVGTKNSEHMIENLNYSFKFLKEDFIKLSKKNWEPMD